MEQALTQFLFDLIFSIILVIVIVLIGIFYLLKPQPRKRKLVLLVGPSGSGKTTLQRNLIKDYPNEYEDIVSCTTRNPRDGEKNGVDYHFLSKENFKNWDFIESAQVGDNFYGTPTKEFYKSEKNIVHVLDPYGAYNIKQNKKLQEDFKIIIVFMDISKETIMKYTQDEERLKRDEKDNIRDRFEEKGLTADYTVPSLHKDLHKEVHDWILFQ